MHRREEWNGSCKGLQEGVMAKPTSVKFQTSIKFQTRWTSSEDLPCPITSTVSDNMVLSTDVWVRKSYGVLRPSGRPSGAHLWLHGPQSTNRSRWEEVARGTRQMPCDPGFCCTPDTAAPNAWTHTHLLTVCNHPLTWVFADILQLLPHVPGNPVCC